MKFSYKIIGLLLVAFTLIVSCKTGMQKTSGDSGNQEFIDKEEIKESIKEVAYPLPEPFELYKMLEDIGALYVGKVLNPVANADKYFTDKNKAVNIGVFAADLGYVSTYNNQVDFKAYSKVVKSLVDDLGVRIDYTSLQNEEGKEKLSNKDTLVNYLTDVFYETYSFLYAESSPSLAGLMAAGAWVEGMYIATHISEDTFNNYDIVKIIYEQGASLENLIELMSKFQDDELAGSLLKAFTKLKGMYDETDGSLNEKQLKSITTAIEMIRSSIIS